MSMSLLAKAKKLKPKRVTASQRHVPHPELEELAVALVRGDVQYFQIANILKTSGSSVYSILFNSLRQGIQENRIKISHKKAKK